MSSQSDPDDDRGGQSKWTFRLLLIGTFATVIAAMAAVAQAVTGAG